MTGRDWDLRGARLAGLQFAEWLVINGGRADNFVDEYQVDADRAWAAAEAYGWVETVQPTNGSPRRLAQRMAQPRPRLTGAGHLKVEEVRSLRNNPQARASACREALLLWIAHEGRGAASADLLVKQDASRFYDSPFSLDEVNEAGKFLVETGLVRAIGVWGAEIVRPVLTSDGQRCVEFFDGNVREYLNPRQNGGPVTYQQHFHGSVSGQVAQGETVNMTQSQGIDAASLSEIFRAMREALSSVEDPEDREDASDAIRELELAVAQGDTETIQKQAGRLKRLASRIGSTALATATTVGTTEVLQAFGLS